MSMAGTLVPRICLHDQCKIASSGPVCGDVYEGDETDHEPVEESQSPKFIVCNYSYLI